MLAVGPQCGQAALLYQNLSRINNDLSSRGKWGVVLQNRVTYLLPPSSVNGQYKHESKKDLSEFNMSKPLNGNGWESFSASVNWVPLTMGPIRLIH